MDSFNSQDEENNKFDFVEAPLGNEHLGTNFSAGAQKDKFLGGNSQESPSKGSPAEARREFPEIKAWTFTEAQAQPKGFSRRFVIGFLNNDLVGIDGRKDPPVKSHLDQVLPDDEENRTAHSPQALAQLHTNAAQMITENLKVMVVDASEKQKDYVRFQKTQYTDRLQKNSEEWKETLEKLAAGERPKGFYTRAGEFHGFMIKTQDGSSVDIAQFGGKKFSNVRSNIGIQPESVEQFIHWETDAATKAKVSGQPVNLDRRIYLNPKTSELVHTFSTLMQSFNEAGILVQGKMLDRSYELANHIDSSERRPIRADAIVLAVGEADADNALNMVLSMYRENPSIFADRPTPKIPLKIAPGIAVGDEPREEGVSLTSHHAGIIEKVSSLTRQRLGINGENKVTHNHEDGALHTFQQTFTEVARENGVNPYNLAFNLPKTA